MMDRQGQRPDPAPVLDLLNAFRRSQVLFTAVDFGIFDIISSSTRDSLQIEQLRSAISQRRGEEVSADGLDRLCRTCVALGLLDCPSPDTYSLNPLSSSYLVSDAPESLTGYCTHSKQVVWPLFSSLPAAVATGSNVWHQQFGRPGADVFAAAYASPADQLRFMRAMHSFAALSAPALVRAFDLSWARHLVDLGGASGALAAAACEAYPGMERAVVVDLPGVVATAEAHFAPRPGQAGAGRVTWLAADFFTQQDLLPKEVDVVVLSRILHDWDDPRCAALLATAASLLRPGGCVLLGEMLLRPDRLGPAPAMLQDLNMLCQTHGRERSEAEYAALLAGADLERVSSVVTGTYLDAVVAWKPGANRQG